MYIKLGPTTKEYEYKQQHVTVELDSDELTLDEVWELFKGALQAYGYVIPEEMDT